MVQLKEKYLTAEFFREILYFMKKGTSKITEKAIVKTVQNYVKLSDEEITKTLEGKSKKIKFDR